MKKLKLEALEVSSFETVKEVPAQRGTVAANQDTVPCTRWDCSIDFCSDFGGCGPTIALTTNTW